MLMLRLYFMVKIVDMRKNFPDSQKLSNENADQGFWDSGEGNSPENPPQ